MSTDSRGGAQIVAPTLSSVLATVGGYAAWNELGNFSIVLMAMFIFLGVALYIIPNRSRYWDKQASNYIDTLQQSVVTVRVLIALVIVMMPLIIIAGELGKDALPQQVEKYITEHIRQTVKFDKILEVETDVERQANLTGKVEIVSGSLQMEVVSSRNHAGSEATASADSGKFRRGTLYILDTRELMETLTEREVLGVVHTTAILVWILSGVFIVVIFLMELVVGIVTEAKEARPHAAENRPDNGND